MSPSQASQPEGGQQPQDLLAYTALIKAEDPTLAEELQHAEEKAHLNPVWLLREKMQKKKLLEDSLSGPGHVRIELPKIADGSSPAEPREPESGLEMDDPNDQIWAEIAGLRKELEWLKSPSTVAQFLFEKQEGEEARRRVLDEIGFLYEQSKTIEGYIAQQSPQAGQMVADLETNINDLKREINEFQAQGADVTNLEGKLAETSEQLERAESSFVPGFSSLPQDLEGYTAYIERENPTIAGELQLAEFQAARSSEALCAEKEQQIEILMKELLPITVTHELPPETLKASPSTPPQSLQETRPDTKAWGQVLQLQREIEAMTPDVIERQRAEKDEGEREMARILERIRERYEQSTT
jgi:hypothetical protein